MIAPTDTPECAALETAETADRTQAVYFADMLGRWCAEVDVRIARYQRALTGHEADNNADGARRCLRMIRAEQRERHRLEGMVAALHRRFPGTRSLEDVSGRTAAAPVLR